MEPLPIPGRVTSPWNWNQQHQAVNAVFDGIDLQDSMHKLITKEYNPSTKTLDLSKDKLTEFPISPILRIIDRVISTSGLEVETLNLSHNDLFGVIHGDLLPSNLKVLDLSNNDLFSFSIPLLRILPSGLKTLYIQNNHFCDNGDFAWHLLPRQLTTLRMFGNAFIGKIQWNALPMTLQELVVSADQVMQSMDTIPDHWKMVHETDEREHEVTFRNTKNQQRP